MNGGYTRVLILRSPFETFIRIQHEPVGREEGLTTEQLKAIRFTPPFAAKEVEKILGPELTTAMEFCDWTTKNIGVPDEVFNKLHTYLNDTQMVEAMGTTGLYSFVSRFVVGLDVDGKANTTVPIPE